MNSIRR